MVKLIHHETLTLIANFQVVKEDASGFKLLKKGGKKGRGNDFVLGKRPSQKIYSFNASQIR